MDRVKKEIKALDALCITHEEKELRIEELKQLNKSIAYTLKKFLNVHIMSNTYVQNREKTFCNECHYGTNHVQIKCDFNIKKD